VPHRDPSLLQRQWRVASGVQKSYTKSDAEKERRRTYEAKRRKLRASMPNSRVVRGQEVSIFFFQLVRYSNNILISIYDVVIEHTF